MPEPPPTKEQIAKWEASPEKAKLEAKVAKLPTEEVREYVARGSKVAEAELVRRKAAPVTPEKEVTPETVVAPVTYLGKDIGTVDPESGEVWTRTGWRTEEQAAVLADRPLKPHETLVALKEQGATTAEQFKYMDTHREAARGAGAKVAREARAEVIQTLAKLEGQEKIDYLAKLGRVPKGAEALEKGYITQSDITKYMADLKSKGLIEPDIVKMIEELPVGKRYLAIQSHLKDVEERHKKALVTIPAKFITKKGIDVAGAIEAGVPIWALKAAGISEANIKGAQAIVRGEKAQAERIRVSEAERKQFEATHTKLRDGQWLANEDLRTIKRDSPDMYSIIIKEGYSAYSKAIDAHNKKVAKQIADFEADLPNQLKVFQLAYKQGGFPLYNKAIENWNKQAERKKAEFEADLKNQPEELQEAYRVGGLPAYSKAVDEYNKAAKAQNVLYRANQRALGNLKPYTDKDGNIGIARYLRDNPDDTKTLADAGIKQSDIKIAVAFNTQPFVATTKLEAYYQALRDAGATRTPAGWKYPKGFVLDKHPEIKALAKAATKRPYKRVKPPISLSQFIAGWLATRDIDEKDKDKIGLATGAARAEYERLYGTGQLLMAVPEMLVPGVYVARNWTTLSTKDKIVNIGIDVASVALCFGIFKVAGIAARQLTGVTRVAKIAVKAGKAGQELRTATKTFAQIQKIGKLKVGSPLWVKHANKVAQLQQKSLKADKVFLRELEKLDTLSKKQLLNLEKRSGLKGLARAVTDISKAQGKITKAWKAVDKLNAKHWKGWQPTKKGRISPHAGREIELIIKGKKPAGIVIGKDAIVKARAAKLVVKEFVTREGMPYAFIAKNQRNLNRLIRASRLYDKGHTLADAVKYDKAMGKALGYTKADVTEWIVRQYGTTRPYSKDYLQTLAKLQEAQVELQSALSRAGSVLKPRYTPSPPAAEFRGYGMEWKPGTPSPKVDASSKDTLSAIESFLARSREVTPTGKEFWRMPKVAVAVAEKPKIEPKPLSTLKIKAAYKKVKAKPTPKPKVPEVKPSAFPGIKPIVKVALKAAPAIIPSEAFGRMTAAEIARIYGTEELVDAVSKTTIQDLTKLKEIQKLSPASMQSIRSMTEAATRSAIKAQAKARVAAEVKGLTKSATAAKVQQAMRVAIRKIVEVRIATKPVLAPLAKSLSKVLIQSIIKIVPKEKMVTRIPIKPIEPIKPKEPIKPIIPIPLPKVPSDKKKREAIRASDGALAWRHGELHGKNVWHVFMYPYKSKADFLTVVGKRPRNSTLVKGPGSAKQSIKLLYGREPDSKVTGDIGVFDFLIEPTGRKSVDIEFKPDPQQRTTGDITIGKKALLISDRRPSLSDKRLAISDRRAKLSGRGMPRITPLRPKLRR